jgi:uncharacterized iron-regulated membrane protein
MADTWVFWLAVALGIGFAVVLALAGMPLVGLFLAGVVVWAARAAESQIAREETDAALKRGCNRLPLCDCGYVAPLRPWSMTSSPERNGIATA